MARRPGDPNVLAALAVLTGEAVHAEHLLRYFDAADAANYLGLAALESGDGARAAEQLEHVVGLLPESRDSRLAFSRWSKASPQETSPDTFTA